MIFVFSDITVNMNSLFSFVRHIICVNLLGHIFVTTVTSPAVSLVCYGER